MHPENKKKHLISASRRTDIPAFYGDWLLNRVNAGYCLVRNPFNYKQETRVNLENDQVEAFIFWTRNPSPFVKNLRTLLTRGYNAGFFVTLNNYPNELETKNPDFRKVVAGVFELKTLLGKNKIVWRYDPIIISNKTDFSWHLENFSMIAEELSGSTDCCVISLADFYKKTSKNLQNLEQNEWIFQKEQETSVEITSFLRNMQKIAIKNEISLTSCCETSENFEKARILPAGCINKKFVSNIIGNSYEGKTHKGQRPSCKCLKSIDIGAYDTCKHGCLYCYATRSHEKAANYSLNISSEKL